MTPWDRFIEEHNYDGLENYIGTLQLKISKSLQERLLNYYLTNELLDRFMEFYKTLGSETKQLENIQTLIITYYQRTTNIIEMKKIIQTISQPKRRHIIPLMNHLCIHNIEEAHSIITKYHPLLKMEDFQLFINSTQGNKHYIKSILEILTNRNIVFDDLILLDSSPCNHTLYYKNIDCSNFIRKIINRIPNKYNEFREFLQDSSYDIVIDTANILYSILPKQNPIPNQQSFLFLRKILNNLKDMGYRAPLLIIHERHKRYNCLDIFQNNRTYWTPKNMNDDYFSLIACWTKYPIPIVTQDLFLDHKFLIGGEDIQQWYIDMHVNYTTDGKITNNPKYSSMVQKNNNHWHIPTTNGMICY
jgi:hypothetical protein